MNAIMLLATLGRPSFLDLNMATGLQEENYEFTPVHHARGG